jgi:hypothetical protein
MKWVMYMTQNGHTTHQEGELRDPFMELERQAGEGGARISMSVHRSCEDYGRVKCSCNVTITCPQNKESLDYAAELAFGTALRYVNHGMLRLAPNEPPI